MLTASNSLDIRADKIDGFIRIYDGSRFLTLFVSEKYNAIYNRGRYLRSLKSGTTYRLINETCRIVLVQASTQET